VSICDSNSNPLLAGQLNWFDPDTGETVVYNGGDIAWTLASTALVWIMVPGVGFFYAVLLRRKNGLSMIYLSVGTIAVVSFQVCSACYSQTVQTNYTLQWFFWGFSLAFSDTANLFIGDLRQYRPISLPALSINSYASYRLFWVERCFREALHWESQSAIHSLLRLPADVRCNYVCASISWDSVCCTN
jgi:hypothetical protein